MHPYRDQPPVTINVKPWWRCRLRVYGFAGSRYIPIGSFRSMWLALFVVRIMAIVYDLFLIEPGLGIDWQVGNFEERDGGWDVMTDDELDEKERCIRRRLCIPDHEEIPIAVLKHYPLGPQEFTDDELRWAYGVANRVRYTPTDGDDDKE